MAKKTDMSFHVDFDPKKFPFADPQRLKQARKNAVTAAGMVWADETKELVREEDHIDTSLYVNSIGYVTDFPEDPNSQTGKVTATESDVIYELVEETDQTTLRIGSNVAYAEALEKRYSLFARGLDRARPRMKTVSDFQVAKTLGG